MRAKPSKLYAVLSYLAAMRREFFSLLKERSTRLRKAPMRMSLIFIGTRLGTAMSKTAMTGLFQHGMSGKRNMVDLQTFRPKTGGHGIWEKADGGYRFAQPALLAVAISREIRVDDRH